MLNNIYTSKHDRLVWLEGGGGGGGAGGNRQQIRTVKLPAGKGAEAPSLNSQK